MSSETEDQAWEQMAEEAAQEEVATEDTPQIDDAPQEVSEPQVEAQTEVAEEPGEPPASEKPEAPRNDQVPLATFLEQKRELKETRDLMRQLQAQIEELKPKEPEVTIDDDPVGYLEKQNRVTQEKLDELAGKMRETDQNQQISQARAYVDNLERAFSQEHTDYYEALAHLQASRAKQHLLVGIPQENALKAVNEELAWVTKNALMNRKNPAQVVYELAKTTGFGNKAISKDTQKLKDLARAQQQSSTLASAAGQTGHDEIDVAAANAMSDKEFNERFIGDDAAFEALFK